MTGLFGREAELSPVLVTGGGTVAVRRRAGRDSFFSFRGRLDDESALPRITAPRRLAERTLAERLPSLFGTGLVLVFFGAVAIAGGISGGQIAQMRAAIGEPQHALGRLFGFGIERINISGHVELTEAELLAAIGVDNRQSLPFIDVAEIRNRLMRIPLVQDASVRKLYPGTLAIELKERDAFAIWQNHNELFVVSADGTAIEPMTDPRFASLPQVVGEKANLRVKEFAALLDKSADVKPRVQAGVLVAGRRWNLKLTNGLLILLPEHDPETAMLRLGQLQREQRILERDVISIDLREPDRLTVRLSEEAAAQRWESAKKKMGKWKGSDA